MTAATAKIIPLEHCDPHRIGNLPIMNRNLPVEL
jgi:hypothetical protein